MEQHVEELGVAAGMDRHLLTPDEIAAFLDGELEGAELSRVQSLLAVNPDARQELIKASRILSSAPSSRRQERSLIPAFATLAAAAAIAVVFMPARKTERDVAPSFTERRAAAEEPQKIHVVVPVEGSSISNDEHPFTWREVEEATAYRVVITDVSGKTVLQESTADTVLAIPEALLKNGDATYYFEVDTRLPDGSSVGSGAHEFDVTRW